MIYRHTFGPFTDYWALGVIAYRMMTGKLPFNGDTPFDIESQILNLKYCEIPNHVDK